MKNLMGYEEARAELLGLVARTIRNAFRRISRRS